MNLIKVVFITTTITITAAVSAISGRWIAGIVGVLLLAALLVIGHAYKNARDAATTMYTPVSKSTKSNKNRSSLDKILDAKKPVNLLILGTDTGAEGRSVKNYHGLTDLMMFVTVNPSKKQTRVTTIARDSKVNLPDYRRFHRSS